MEHLSKIKRTDLEDMFSCLLSDMKEQCPEVASKYVSDLEEYMYTISKDEAINIVSDMKPSR